MAVQAPLRGVSPRPPSHPDLRREGDQLTSDTVSDFVGRDEIADRDDLSCGFMAHDGRLGDWSSTNAPREVGVHVRATDT